MKKQREKKKIKWKKKKNYSVNREAIKFTSFFLYYLDRAHQVLDHFRQLIITSFSVKFSTLLEILLKSTGIIHLLSDISRSLIT